MSFEDKLKKKSPDRLGMLDETGMTLCNGINRQMQQILSEPLLAEMSERNALQILFGESRDKSKLLGIIPVNEDGRQTAPVSQQEVLKRLRQVNDHIDDLRTAIDTRCNGLFGDLQKAVMQGMESDAAPHVPKGAIQDYNALATNRGCLVTAKTMIRDLSKGIEALNPSVFKPQPLQMELL